MPAFTIAIVQSAEMRSACRTDFPESVQAQNSLPIPSFSPESPRAYCRACAALHRTVQHMRHSTPLHRCPISAGFAVGEWGVPGVPPSGYCPLMAVLSRTSYPPLSPEVCPSVCPYLRVSLHVSPLPRCTCTFSSPACLFCSHACSCHLSVSVSNFPPVFEQ